MMFALTRNIKTKLMVVLNILLFVHITIAHDGGIYTIAMIIESRAEIFFMISCLTVRILFIEVMVEFPYSLLLICQI